ncbi:hypothetical protein GRI75_12870 [Altererythrobacter soli]|uniref:Uncharacterized protein n=1 Tax=Croceibacterium soli TaxID=1739690 RepID=A0A6I4UY69_9SPHN|nr:hypothetical protein [Croceibacterium soli]MXP42533.1 hypothetical protein [Croceibacterium soli]
MRERFELFRLSLLQRQQIDAFEARRTREEYLRAVFLDRWVFEYYGNEFHYVPDEQQPRSDVILARIGRKLTTTENLPPDEGFADTLHQGWKALAVLIDPREHRDGQKAAVALNERVGSPQRLIAEVVRTINSKLPNTDWHIEVEPIPDTESFWQYARKHEGEITNLAFEFVPPNMFGGSDDLSEELRQFRKAEHAEKVTLILKAQEGLDAVTKRTKEAVDYISKAGGTIRARSKRGRAFSSTRKTATTRIDEPDVPEETKASALARLASRILGHE